MLFLGEGEKSLSYIELKARIHVASLDI